LNTPADKIRAEIATSGAISFARFMELALYCPDCGYYEKKNETIGQHGDFYTSVSVGPVFGNLLAFQFAEWLEELRTADGGLQIVEAGAHQGQLARDILIWLRQRRAELFQEIEYWIIEPSGSRQELQRHTLGELASKTRWFANFDARQTQAGNDPPSVIRHPPGVCGIIFGNELLDALPVHRLGWDARERDWYEWGVAISDGNFAWARLPKTPHSSHHSLQVPPELREILPDGFTTEICPAAESWWRAAASRLNRGRLLAIDYGLNAGEFFSPQRAGGTLRAYHRHRLRPDVFANVGEQDLTAHVNFSAIQAAGEASGLRTELLETQEHFLTEIARRAWDEGSGFGPWTSTHTRQFQTLAHPEHLGRPFRVLVQVK
jgi:SAM-dependent MidA family methyltransferase